MIARRTASHIQNPACSVGDSRDRPIDERFARLPLRLRPRGPIPKIADAPHAVIGAGTRGHRLSSDSLLMLGGDGLDHLGATLDVKRSARGVAGRHTLPVSLIINDLRSTHQ
jgi:hypothetical protein